MSVKTYAERVADMKTNREETGATDGLYHANINVLNRETLEDAVEHPVPEPHRSRLRLRGELRQAHQGAAARRAEPHLPPVGLTAAQ